MADVLCESVLIVGLGGLLSLPLGVALASGLDGILKTHAGHSRRRCTSSSSSRARWRGTPALLAVTAIAAALYPMQLVARLPIAATLRNEVVS